MVICSDPIRDFISLCEKGDIDKVKKAVEVIPGYLGPLDHGGIKCAFYYAVKNKQWELCDWMMDNGAVGILPYIERDGWDSIYLSIPDADEKYLRYLFKDERISKFITYDFEIDPKYLLLFPKKFVLDYLKKNKVYEPITYHHVEEFENQGDYKRCSDEFKYNMQTIDPRIAKKICQNMTNVPDEIVNRYSTCSKSAFM